MNFELEDPELGHLVRERPAQQGLVQLGFEPVNFVLEDSAPVHSKQEVSVLGFGPQEDSARLGDSEPLQDLEPGQYFALVEDSVQAQSLEPEPEGP